MLPLRVCNSTTFAVIGSTWPLTAICRPLDADWTSVHALPLLSMIAPLDGDLIVVPFTLGNGVVSFTVKVFDPVDASLVATPKAAPS